MIEQIATINTFGPALQKLLAAFPDAYEKSNGWWTHDDNPTFDFRENENGSLAIHSWTGRSVEEILAIGNLKTSDLYSRGGYFKAKIRNSLDIFELAQAKRIHWHFLQSIGIQDEYRYKGYSCVKIPYYLPDGTQHTKIKVRKAVGGKYKHCWDEGTPGDIIPYGLHKLHLARETGYLLIGEGETDAWACWVHNVPYLGIPGATMQKTLTGIDLNDIPALYILVEPDQLKVLQAKGEGFYKDTHNKLRSQGYTGEIFCIDFKEATGYKDPSELHIALWDSNQIGNFEQILTSAKEQAIPANDMDERNLLPGTNTKPDIDFILDCLKNNEWGDALLFASLFRGQVLYDHTACEWYIWDTHHWKIDDYTRIKHYVSGHLASVYIQAGATLNTRASEQEMLASTKPSSDGTIDLLKDETEEQARAKDRFKALKKQMSALTERAFALRQVSRNKNVLNFANSLPGMGIIADQWDRNPWLLAVSNGVIDLKTGTLRDGQPADYIRTVCPTAWQGIHAPAHRWERFLQEIFEDRTDQEREEIITFLQRIFGYGITGEVREHVFLILFGEDGRNGKDSLQHAITYALGNVSSAISKDVLLANDKNKTAGSASPHLMDLQGKRLAWANEPEKGAQFNIGQIKDLSGGGDIPARGLFERKFTKIKPSHLLILLTNHKPHADANDAAFWDRLRLVTFNMRYVDKPVEPNERKKDASLWTELENEASGILAWLVRGCLDWQQDGLTTPQSVMKDGKNYRQDEDMIHLFLSECCILQKNAQTDASKLYEAYRIWCKSGNTREEKCTKFGIELGKKKIEKKRVTRGMIYVGVGLLNTENVGSSDDSSELYIPYGSASQETLEGIENTTHVGYVGLNPKLPKMTSHEGSNLELTEATIHTLHSGMQEEVIQSLVEPVHNTMYSSENLTSGGMDSSKTLHITSPIASDITKLLADFKKKYEGKDQTFWTAPQTGFPNGYLTPKAWYERFNQCYTSTDVKVKQAAIEALIEKVNV